MRTLFKGGHFPVAHFVEDSTWIFVAKIVYAASLPLAKHAQCGFCQLRRERNRLQAREDAVAAEHGHEPWKTGRGKAAPTRDRRREAQRGEVDEAAPIRHLQRVPVAFETWRILEPALEAPLHVGSSPPLPPLVLGPDVRSARAGCRDDVEIGRPRSVWLDVNVEGQAFPVQLGRCRRGNCRLALVRPSFVTEVEAPVPNLS